MTQITKHVRLAHLEVTLRNGRILRVPWLDLKRSFPGSYTVLTLSKAYRRDHAEAPRRVVFCTARVHRVVGRLQIRAVAKEIRSGIHDTSWKLPSVWELLRWPALAAATVLVLLVARIGIAGEWPWTAPEHELLPPSYYPLLAVCVCAFLAVLIGPTLFLLWPYVRMRLHHPKPLAFRTTATGLEVTSNDHSNRLYPWTQLTDIGKMGTLVFGNDNEFVYAQRNDTENRWVVLTHALSQVLLKRSPERVNQDRAIKRSMWYFALAWPIGVALICWVRQALAPVLPSIELHIALWTAMCVLLPLILLVARHTEKSEIRRSRGRNAPENR